ncbi:hypothetical protein BBP40_002569 [Aspergillus hancockii]|nr:hypothetical protein BBP40_002569 [Aspergillus hancockii]
MLNMSALVAGTYLCPNFFIYGMPQLSLINIVDQHRHCSPLAASTRPVTHFDRSTKIGIHIFVLLSPQNTLSAMGDKRDRKAIKSKGSAFIKTLKSGERVIVDPELTVERMFMWFYWAVNIGALSPLITVNVEAKVSFWLASLIPLKLAKIRPSHISHTLG